MSELHDLEKYAYTNPHTGRKRICIFHKNKYFLSVLYIMEHFLSSSWSSNLIVFLVAGCVVTLLLAIVLIEKFTCVPKKMSRLIVLVTGNKMLHQLMAITNILTLLSCVLLPMVSLLRFEVQNANVGTQFGS